MEAVDGAHQIVVDPQPAHCVVNRGIDAHRHLVRILISDALVHLEQVPVPLADHAGPEALDGVAEVEIDAEAGFPDTPALVADFLCCPRCDVARRQVAEAWIFSLEKIVPLTLRNFARLSFFAGPPGHPHPSVVSEGFTHQRQLRLIITAHGNAGWMDLGETRIGESGATLVRPPDRGRIGALRVGRQIVDVAVSTRRQHDRLRHMGLDGAGDEIARDDPTRLAIDHDEIKHLGAWVHCHTTATDLLFQRLIRAEQQLLAGLSARIESPRDLRTAERAVCQQPAVFSGERHSLRHALVDDVYAQLGEAVHVSFARAKIAALDGVVEEPINAVTIVLIILGGVDAALGSDAVGATR